MIYLRKIDNSFGYIDTDDFSSVHDIYEEFSFYVPGYKFTEKYKMGLWDGRIRLIELNSSKYPLGLSRKIQEFCKNVLNEKCELDDDLKKSFSTIETKEDIEKFCKQFKFYSKGKEIFLRDDQLYAIVRAINSKRCINICPTSFGKSLSIFVELLWNIHKAKKTLLIVPTVDLVHQFANDIEDYCTDENGNLTSYFPKIHKIFAGQDKEIKKSDEVVISTWQSIYQFEPSFFNQFNAIVLDECHKGKGPALRKIMMAATDVDIRTGWTGSLEKYSINEMLVLALFGDIEEITTTSKLMNEKIVADLQIVCTHIKYPQEMCKMVYHVDYSYELMFLEKIKERSRFILNVANSMNSTGIVLFKHRKHGEYLFDNARMMFPEKNIYLIYGGRYQRNDEKYKGIEELKPLIEAEKDSIIIAIYSMMGTGISIKNLHWGLFAVPIKSYITAIQSIGRLLRVSDTKRSAILIDIIDDLAYKRINERSKRVYTSKNFALSHFIERFKYYNDQKFSHTVKDIYLNCEIPKEKTPLEEMLDEED